MDGRELNFTEICRCCKRPEAGLTSIFDGNAHPTYPPVEEMLSTIASLNVQENDGLPSLVCTSCLKNIQDAYTFIQQLIQIDSELWQILARRKRADTHHQEETSDENNVDNANRDIGNFLKSLLIPNKTLESEVKENDSAHALTAKKAKYACDQCDKSYAILKSLQTHVRDHHCFATIYECKLCHANISYKQHLQRHLYLHLKEKPFVCNQCKMGFNRMNRLIKHQAVCKGDASLTCEICNRRFTVKTSLELHKGFHDSEDVNRSLTLEDLEEPMQFFEQHGIDDIIDNQDIAKIEVEVDLGPAPEDFNELPDQEQQDQQKLHTCRIYNCIICGLKFKRMYHLKRHLLVHCKDKALACSQCNRTFNRKDKLEKHSKICKGVEQLLCEVCNRVFKTAESLETHKTIKHRFVSKSPSITLEDIQLNLQKYYTESYEDANETNALGLGLASADDDTNESTCQDAPENVEEAEEVDSDEIPLESLAKRRKTKSNDDKFEVYNCKLCDFTCSRLYHLKRHLQTHLKDKPFACSKCCRTFARRDKMLRHWRTCGGEARFVCEFCNIGCHSELKLEDHIEAYHADEEEKSSNQLILNLEELRDPEKIKKYYTYSVNESVRNDVDLNDDDELLKIERAEDLKVVKNAEEDNQVDNENFNSVDSSDGDYSPYGIRRKSRKFKGRGPGRPPKSKVKAKSKVNVKTKAETESNDVKDEPSDDDELKSFTCIVCNQMFEQISLLEAHGKEFHETEHVLQCRKCSQTFQRVCELNQHMRKHKNQSMDEVQERLKRPKRFECNHCLKRFTTPQAMRQHSKKHKEGGFVCPKCSKPFLSKSNLTEHMKFHGTTKKFLCSECGQGFVRNDYLIIHMRRHSGEKPFKCSHCGKGFPRVTDLKVHERYHTGEKKHLCVVCGRGFIRAYNLTVHMRTHTGEKPYKCQYCDSAFAQCNDLKSHVRRHTGERFQCDLCPLNFLMGYELIQHKRKVHGMNIVSNIRRLNTADAQHDGDAEEPETVALPQPVIPMGSDLDPLDVALDA